MRSFLRNIALAAFALWASHANALPVTPIQGASGVTQIAGLSGPPADRGGSRRHVRHCCQNIDGSARIDKLKG